MFAADYLFDELPELDDEPRPRSDQTNSTDLDRSLVLKWVHPSSDWPDRALAMCPLKLRWED